ncbi:MAG TPA: spirocyclase AveC family protein [Mycobacterium sp.]|uniref:spirocyclase AveC family protein n=1 Tax=Mycobacterium sp. TaxID=1785 RepID=UPI002D51E800|nr:spirocyclase AveC family protein [Mycobacterium sp.]HZU47775.1 spirocyclase AveC family protein [Mycobacterium sp.]
MTTEQTQPSLKPSTDTGTAARKKRSLITAASVIVAVAVIAVIAYYARTGAVSDRIRNPDVTGAPRPVRPLFVYAHWLGFLQHVFTVGTMLAIIVVFVVAWRRHPRHPVLLMAIVTTLIVWQDPLMNWAPYAVYNPQLWHFPEDWPLVSLSPTVEPFVVIGYVMFQLGPYFPAIWILRRIQARRPVDSFVWRHPLICMAGLIFVIGFIVDAFLEITLVRTGMYIYSQVIPWLSVFPGKPWQFPLYYESALVTLVMIPAGVLLYRDDTGRTVAEKLAQRARIFAGRPTLGMFVVMLVIINVAYFGYGLSFAVVKWTRAATSVACPWPYPEAKVYDPQGFYERNGQPGPYSVGIWSTWMSGQPHGRPQVQPPVNGGRCSPP